MDPRQAELCDGRALYPDRNGTAWPRNGKPSIRGKAWTRPRLDLLACLERTLPAFAALMAQHRPKALRGLSLAEVLATAERTPDGCARRIITGKACPAPAAGGATLAFAVLARRAWTAKSHRKKKASSWPSC